MAQDSVRFPEGSILELKKPHPCGGRRFEVMHAGMDVRLKCLQCGSQIRLPRRKFEKMVSGIRPSV